MAIQTETTEASEKDSRDFCTIMTQAVNDVDKAVNIAIHDLMEGKSPELAWCYQEILAMIESNSERFWQSRGRVQAADVLWN